ncbi:MAG: transposase [Gammaproteobacteria bacterium]|nr:transposase [Gammaproteobacteria bacterium]
MLRKGRCSIGGQIYMVTSTTHQRRKLFVDFELGRMLVRCFAHQHHKSSVSILAFTVMPDYFHWLLALSEDRQLSKVVGQVKSYSGRLIRHRLKMSGGMVWQDGFHDHALRREDDIQEVARYIVANPLRAGLVERVGDYPLWDAIWL